MKNILFIILCSVFMLACEKEIEVDLNTTNPQLVIEATLDNQQDTATVRLTRSVNFSDANDFPAVSGALVVITDSEGTSYPLTETAPGIYQNTGLRGVVGYTYFLSVTTPDGQIFTAESTLPAPVPFDGVDFLVRGAFQPGGNSDSDTTFFAIPRFFDPADEPNQYRFTQTVNGLRDHEIIVRNDNVFNGKVNEQPIFSPDLDIYRGDTLRVEMMCIDQSVYNYFFSLSQSIGNGPNASATPANPVSNIQGGALGYFSAYSLQVVEQVVE